MNGIPVINMTNFFNSELFLYSLGDIRLPKPVSLKKAGFFLAGVVLWTTPLIMIFGFSPNLFFWVFAIAPPLLIAYIADKPIFDGRGIFDATATTARYISRPKCWADGTATDLYKETEYKIEQEIWISRRRELNMLARIREERDARQA